MKNTHTPGPWKIYHGSGIEKRIAAETNSAICVLHGPFDWAMMDEYEDEQMANAQLIAVAPEMLEASKAVIAAWEHGDLAGAVRRLAEIIDFD